MTQEEQLLHAIEIRGNRITTYELMTLGIMQYQARLKGLREKLREKGWILTEGQPVIGKKRCFMYELRKPGEQLNLFSGTAA